jgi:hypothetical protein
MKRHGNPPTLQTIQRVDGQLYQTLNTQRLRNASPLQTKLPAKRRLGITSIVLIALIVILLALAVAANSAHAQEIGQPWCQISSAPRPEMQCMTPRAYLPEVTR